MKLPWLLLLLCCACAPTAWQVRTVPPCYQPLPDAAQERERAELAAVLALQNRGYAVTQREGWIEGAGPMHWRLHVTDAGALDVDAPEARDTAQTQAWFGQLQQAIAKIRCGELESLRAQAQERQSSGGEDVAARLIQLHEKHAQTRVGPKVALVAFGGAVAGTGIALGTEALFWRAEGCDVDGAGARDCSLRDLARPFGIAAVSMVVLGGAIVAVSVPRMIDTMRRHRALNREITRLRQLSFGPTGVQFRASF